jgi:CheY-like chemotaxis protein/predicted regulator of Ras-like GTPase activity (Roadblock/LC7/MglB family)
MHILIVDDDKDVLRMLEFGLKKMGPNYQVTTARDTQSAVEQVEKEWFDLVLTDFMMPGMTGIDLARAIRHLSPDTQIVLMTAYGTIDLRDTTDHLGIDGYLHKPFTMEQLREVVQRLTRRPTAPEILPPEPLPSPEPVAPASPLSALEAISVEAQLQALLVDAGARGVLLIDSEGRLVHVVGQIYRSKVDDISALVATNHYNPAELSNLLLNQRTFKASFYEGDTYNLYVCDVNEKFLLAVVFDARLRPGVIWFYAKQTAAALVPLLRR